MSSSVARAPSVARSSRSSCGAAIASAASLGARRPRSRRRRPDCRRHGPPAGDRRHRRRIGRVRVCGARRTRAGSTSFRRSRRTSRTPRRRPGARLVVIENLYMYGPTDGPMTESTPMAATGKKGSLRARLSRDLMERHAAGRLRVAIGRASDYYGPRAVNSAVGEQFFAAIAARQDAALAGPARPAPRAVVPAGHRGRARHARRASRGRWRGLAPAGQPRADRRGVVRANRGDRRALGAALAGDAADAHRSWPLHAPAAGAARDALPVGAAVGRGRLEVPHPRSVPARQTSTKGSARH